MPRFHTPVFAGLLMALSAALPMAAQTSAVAHLAVQGGNGQVACICTLANLQSLQPITVKATDASGNPVAGATITWATVQGTQATLGNTTTVTKGDGTSSNTLSLIIFNNFTSTAVPYLVNNITATANNQNVTFTETQSLVTDQGSSVIQANGPTFNGASLSEATLSANTGSTLQTPINILVAGLNVASNGVPNAAIRLISAQASPSISCAYFGGYADPGSVLSDVHGNASCYPTFIGSGTGQFYVTVGGIPADTIADSLALQQFGPYNFTSVPGAPSSLKIVSGNNQVGSVGQNLNPLVAKLTDANGNPVPGQTVKWSDNPSGATALTNNATVTDNNGLVSTSVTLDLLASAGVQVTVALASNPSISATFQLTLAGAITALNKVSGDNQTAQVNTNFAVPIVVQVQNGSGVVKNYPVQFISNGPVSFVGASGTTATVGTDNNGQATISVKAGSLQGTATVTAVVGILNQVFNLTISPTQTGPTPTAISIVSGNNQSTVLNSSFTSPLVVQVNSASGPLSGATVGFSSTGPITLSAGAATTNGSGQAQITVQAGATAGAATVTATVSGLSPQIFNLTVNPAGPNVNPNSFLNAASRQVGSISPCGLGILSAGGITPDGIADLTAAPLFGRYPLSAHGLSINFAGTPAPIVSVVQGQTNPEVTFQVPCSVTPGSVSTTVTVGGGTTTLSVPVQLVSPGILQTTMTDGVLRAVVTRSDGSFADVGGLISNPARRNEYVRVYVTGLGPTSPTVDTNTIQNPNADLFGQDAAVAGTVQAGIVGFGGLQVISARMAPDLIGIYEVQLAIPSNAPTGNSVQITVGIVPAGSAANTQATTSVAALIPIQ